VRGREQQPSHVDSDSCTVPCHGLSIIWNERIDPRASDHIVLVIVHC
jgi:hypothetical protein